MLPYTYHCLSLLIYISVELILGSAKAIPNTRSAGATERYLPLFPNICGSMEMLQTWSYSVLHQLVTHYPSLTKSVLWRWQKGKGKQKEKEGLASWTAVRWWLLLVVQIKVRWRCLYPEIVSPFSTLVDNLEDWIRTWGLILSSSHIRWKFPSPQTPGTSVSQQVFTPRPI